MKTWNFPNKVRIRRQNALDRIKARYNGKTVIPTAVMNEMTSLEKKLKQY